MPNHLCAWIALATLSVVSACSTPLEVDWRSRTAVVDMPPSSVPGVIGHINVAGRIDATAFTPDALWIVISTPTKRGLPINRVARISLDSNRFVDLFAVGGFSGASLAADAESVWVAEGLGGTKVHRIDAKKQRIVASIQLTKNPIALAVGEGAVWVLAADQVNELGGILLSVRGLALFRIDPISNVVIYSISLPRLRQSTERTDGTVAVWAGSVWIATRNNEVMRIDPRSGRIEASIPIPGTATELMSHYQIITNDGRLLLLRRTSENPNFLSPQEAARTTIWQIDPQSNRLLDNPADFDTEGVVVSFSDDTCWLGSSRKDAVTACDPHAFLPTGQTRPIGYPVYALTAGHGTLWAFSGGKITRGDERNISWITRLAR